MQSVVMLSVTSWLILLSLEIQSAIYIDCCYVEFQMLAYSVGFHYAVCSYPELLVTSKLIMLSVIMLSGYAEYCDAECHKLAYYAES